MQSIIYLLLPLIADAFIAVHRPLVEERVIARRTARSKHTSLKMVYSDFDPETGMRKFRWNLNVGREPWGFALNAEVWNGRVSMMAFIWVLLQELITGKGVVTTFVQAKSLDEVILPAIIGASFFVLTGALTTVIAVSNNDDIFSPDAVLRDLEDVKKF
mmetsp:Transcript_13275/g.17729  ORF Transcript_13275/g.17729 Transcript_13275/m.17729 type:complete len:159 (+) Transcript_13275:92-568(+)|eukprot:CAMPEP_0197290402 /NCGR_PEP_ID=MMETSP0890-20130614/7620_1 /TAXON_ID=44058 ORGANISM="Aureoumbra lagunensis, Strain CCMP1510" /NCGR_SAMPLE_ID=MMETSP0890 /ASSEMBLY_ACC=CAM_ASM_000533 /LENGTH=158 /DNA_ID=CAMNT_0042762369 /DNA_START=68 /DNA_END=544 /DNA_ORIENTATION=+